VIWADRFVKSAMGKKIAYQQIPEEMLTQGFQAAGLPPHIVLDLTEVLSVFDEFGC
jgi:hypothetical protein